MYIYISNKKYTKFLWSTCESNKNCTVTQETHKLQSTAIIEIQRSNKEGGNKDKFRVKKIKNEKQ